MNCASFSIATGAGPAGHHSLESPSTTNLSASTKTACAVSFEVAVAVLDWTLPVGAVLGDCAEARRRGRGVRLSDGTAEW
jgi:hypothetical protein